MKILLIILLLSPLFLNGKNNESLLLEKINAQESRIDSIIDEFNKENDNLNKELSDLKDKYEFQSKVNELTINSISNQLTAASYNLTIFGILFGLAAIGVGVYITFVERKIIKISEKNVLLLSKSQAIKKEVESINKLIQDDIYGLFLKIKREETLHILNRLLKVPKDISNLLDELLSRDLEKEDYNILKKAYLQLDNSEKTKAYTEKYELVFFQQFLDLILKDEDIGEKLIPTYPRGIRCCFDNDILKSTKDFIKVIINLGIDKKEKEINSYFSGLSNSSFKDSKEIYKIFFDGLLTRENQFTFYNIISNNDSTKVGKNNFGTLLKVSYEKVEDLTVTEKAILEEITEA
ncbi:MAG: hypothetical protein COB67_10195 [SAR324 cluster bacterium]|uniref:Uncharacterized protein n=1 Tax=SAR324 cluster bacterium TaxID=2024889 RepID=A0A2A4SY27_9DELT|nr:MAG: hypothetical protein COB67_10195 [SAR324 cluster bacterium]